MPQAPKPETRTALLFGATGLVGAELLRLLLAHPSYRKVRVATRRPLGLEHPKLEVLQFDFDSLPEYKAVFRAEDVFVALGTTSKKAGSREAFRRVDFDYPLAIGQMALENGAQNYLLVSSVGANAKSVFFYTRLKGELEEALSKLGLPALHIFQPSLLLGQRTERRTAEAWGQALAPAVGWLFVGGLRKYRAVSAKAVAKAMVAIAPQRKPGVHRYGSDVIQELADAYAAEPSGSQSAKT